MKLDKASIGKPCPKCRREITKNVVDNITAIKISNAILSLSKAKANGNKTGPKSTINWKYVASLRKSFMKFTDIAKLLNVSRSYISRECKIRGIK